MRNAENIAALVTLEPDFIGFIFHEKSPRNVVEKPLVSIPNTIKKVGVFVNKSIAFVLQKVTDFDLDYVQLHGDESPEYCNELQEKCSVIKAFNIKPDFDFDKLQAYQSTCSLFLFDAFGKKAGGNGVVFNWDLLANYNGDTPFLLSGGITPKMAEEVKAFSHKKYIGIDINSGFERAAADKNIIAIQTFIKKIKHEISSK